MQELSDEEFGRMMRALYQYERSGSAPEFSDRAMRIMWSSLKSFNDQSYQNLQKTCRVRSEAGKKGNAKRWNTRPETPETQNTQDAPDTQEAQNTPAPQDTADAQENPEIPETTKTAKTTEAANAPVLSPALKTPATVTYAPATPKSVPATPAAANTTPIANIAKIANATGAISSDRKNRLSVSESESVSKSVSGSGSSSESVPGSASVSGSSFSKEPAAGTTKTTQTLGKEFRTNIGRLNEQGQAELDTFADRLGEELVRAVIRKCGDAGGRSWAYVRKALLEAESQGVRSAEEYRLTHPLGAGRNQRVDRQTPSGNNFLANTDLTLSLNRLHKKSAQVRG